MKKFLISLEKDIQRRTLFFSQENTADFQIFSAINTMVESEDELNKRFDLSLFLQKYGREVTKGEIGCTLSHLSVYRLIANDTSIDENAYCLICEDDALLHTDFQVALDTLLAHHISSDIVLLGQSKIDDFNACELELNYPIAFPKKFGLREFGIGYPYKNYYAGTVAYLIKKSAAKRLTAAQNTAKPYWLADDFILFGEQFNLDIQLIRPLIVIENPKINSNLATMRKAIPHNFWLKLIKYPAKKLLAIKRNLGKA